MKKTEPKSIGEIIMSVLRESDLEGAYDEQRISDMWPQVVGTEINNQTVKRYVSDKKLHVYILSAPLKNELNFMRQKIVDALNDRVGKQVITDIVFH